MAAAAELRAPVASRAASSGLCERYSGLPTESGPQGGMVRVAGGRFSMGSDHHYADEAPAQEAVVEPFWIDRHDVTNAQFARFVAATGHVTVAERAATAMGVHQSVATSAVFVMPQGRQAGTWRLVPGADWRHPQGPASSIEGLDNHPVVQVAYDDALAYARWLGRELPTEAQWEFAARGGLQAQPYVWGDRFAPEGRAMANTWQGAFPLVNSADDGFAGTSPVGCFPANGYGLFDMAGNVWQWTATVYASARERGTGFNPGRPADTLAQRAAAAGTAPARVIKGGSHLCAPSVCMRYRPSARQPAEAGLGTSHIGFRTVAPVLTTTASR
ncbi:formylglycine-generating enzyme family protein [Aquincola sp. S2]|uniref:Formylglycine-generating enzyme family protein n=2 Tax=Pseudaquabacterium terrae TaxID=2732868 RepID=A0ABX2ERN9_9BURK|nr:formylglycine-generating enzyme family protein [Aquabacterium terrae]